MFLISSTKWSRNAFTLENFHNSISTHIYIYIYKLGYIIMGVFYSELG